METMTVVSIAAPAGLAKRSSAPTLISSQGRAVPFGGLRPRHGLRGATALDPGSLPGPSPV